MPPARRPSGIDPARFRELFERDPDNPLQLRWRTKPLALFPNARMCAAWNARHAGRPAGSKSDGDNLRVRVDGKSVDMREVIAALGDDDQNDGRMRPDHAKNAGGLLASVILQASQQTGLTFRDLTVLVPISDPYRCGVPAKRRDAEWFVKHWRTSNVEHIRGFHYKLLGRVKKPNGKTYTGSYKDFVWLMRVANAARWLGLLSFEDFEDRRNSDPLIHRAERDATALEVGVSATFDAEPPSIDLTDSNTGEVDLSPTIVGMQAEQPFLLAIFGEKSSIRGEAEPVAIELGADVYLETGEQSITHAYHLAKRAYTDGRHLVVGCVTDCDPSGYQMAVSIARKIQALIDLEFPSLEVDVIHVGLTPAQVRRHRLPSSPLSPKEQRRARWRERMGVQQTEIDALLTLHPGELTKLIRKAFRPYYDPTLASRVDAARWEWRRAAKAEIDRQIEEDPDLAEEMEAIEAKAADITARIERLDAEVERMREAIDWINEEAEAIKTEIAGVDLQTIADSIDLDPPDIPEAELPDQPDDGPNMVLSSQWDWVEATERMKARKAYEEGDGDDADDDSEEESDE
jgi:hypothetical protein